MILKETGTKRIIELCKSKITSIYTAVFKEYNRVANLVYNFLQEGTAINRNSYNTSFQSLIGARYPAECEIMLAKADGTVNTYWQTCTVSIDSYLSLQVNRLHGNGGIDAYDFSVPITSVVTLRSIDLSFAKQCGDKYIFEGCVSYSTGIQYTAYIKVTVPIAVELPAIMASVEVRT